MTSEMEAAPPQPRPLLTMVHDGHCLLDTCEVEDLPNFRCRDTDVWVCSFPRSGTTLTQQMTYLIMTLDFEKGNSVQLDDRFPLADCVYTPDYPYFRGLKHIDQLPEASPRFIKSHLPYRLLPEQLKKGRGRIIYITRNPKAAVVSFYKVLQYMKQPPRPTLREYVQDFFDGKTVLGAPWEKHFRPYWEHREDENVLFIQFEKLIKDRRGTIEKIAEFLGRDLSKADVDGVLEATSLQSMKSNDAVNFMYFEEKYGSDSSHGGYINTGDDSRWRRELSDDLIQRFDHIIETATKGTDVVFE